MNGAVTAMQGEIATLDSDLQHAEEAATGSNCKVSIQTAQSSLLGVKQEFDAIKQALANYDLGALSGTPAPMRQFNSDLDKVDSACGGGSAPNA